VISGVKNLEKSSRKCEHNHPASFATTRSDIPKMAFILSRHRRSRFERQSIFVSERVFEDFCGSFLLIWFLDVHTGGMEMRSVFLSDAAGHGGTESSQFSDHTHSRINI
jgi:hypothetical protein